MDRDPSSDTFGCADRDFWYYRTRTDFAGGGWQQVMLGFAVLASDEDVPEDERHLLASDAANALTAWTRAQHADGSVDEWYRNEHSFCATAFGLAGAAQTMLYLGDSITDEQRSIWLPALSRAAKWLEGRSNPLAMNQNLVAALGLWCLGRIANEARWTVAAEKKFGLIEKSQHAEGWFAEYGGMDFGYSTLALDLLASADMWTAPNAAAMAGKLSNFLASTLGELQIVPGRIGSRGTSHGFAFGAEHFADRFESAAILRTQFRRAHRANRITGPDGVDDRYFAYFYFPQFALAHRTAVKADALPVEISRAEQITYEGCGLTARRVCDSTVLFSRRLGGALAWVDPNGSATYHLGYEAIDRRGRRYSSASWTSGELGKPSEAHAVFQRVADGRPLERWMVPFALFTRLLGVPRLAEFFANHVKARLIRPQRFLEMSLHRRIEVRDGWLLIRDELSAPNASNVRSIRCASEVAMHSPSSRMDAMVSLSGAEELASVLEELKRRGRATIEINVPLAHDERARV
jgi:hypothetical protein